MFRVHSINFFLAVPILIIAFMCAPGIAVANPVNDTFTDIAGQGQDPGDISLIHEHGGPSASWAASDADILISLQWGYLGGSNLGLIITNQSSHTMWNTVLVFEQYDIMPNIFPNWLGILEPDTWDGTVGGDEDPAYWFGDIAPQAQSSIVVVNLKDGYQSPPAFAYDSDGLHSSSFDSTVSVAHAAMVPEPISSTLFLVGAGTLGFRRFRKKRIS